MKTVNRPDFNGSTNFGDYFYDLNSDRSWIMRRVETIHILDRSRVERQVTFDLDSYKIREKSYLHGISGGYVPISLLFLEKQLLLDLDVRDGDNRPIPVAISDKNSQYSTELLIHIARKVLGQHQIVPENIIDDVWKIVQAYSGEELSRVFGEFLKEIPRDWNPLIESDEFINTLVQLARGYFLVLDFDTQSTQRTSIIKVRYTEEFREVNKPIRHPIRYIISRSGVPLTNFNIPVAGIGTAQREHTRLVAPEGSHIWGVSLNTIGDKADLAKEFPQHVRYRTTRQRAIVYTNDMPSNLYQMSVKMTSSRRVFFIPALVSGLILTGILGIGLFFGRFGSGDQSWTLVKSPFGRFDWFATVSSSPHADIGAFVTILSIIPPLAAAYTALRDVHDFIARLLVVPRVLLLVAAVGTFFSAALIALDVQRSVIIRSMWVSFGSSVAVVLVCGLAYLVIWVQQLRKPGQVASTK